MTGFEIIPHELADNPTPRCPCVLALDVSGSMSGEPIRELNGGIQQFFEEIQTDEVARFSVETGIVTFSTGATAVVQIDSTDGCVPPTLTAGGLTSLGKGLHLALDLVEARKSQYQRVGVSYFQPWLVLMTDGQPTDEWMDAAQRVHRLSREKKLSFFGVAVGDGADMDILKQICPPNRPPVRLQGINFRGFFEWLSQSMKCVSGSIAGSRVALPSISSWADVES